MSQFTAELSQLAGIEGSTEDIARDIAPTTPAHPPRAARRETLDVSLDHNIDIDAAREELARRRRAQALASMTDAELQRLLDAGSDPQPVAPAASPADASQVSPIGSNNVAVSVADAAAFPAFGPGMPDASMYASPAGDPMTAAPADQGPLLPLAMSVANIEDPATPVASGAHMGPASNLGCRRWPAPSAPGHSTAAAHDAADAADDGDYCANLHRRLSAPQPGSYCCHGQGG